MVIWDDSAPYKFLEEFSWHSSKHREICAAASKRLEFKNIPIGDIATKRYKIWTSRVKMYQSQHKRGKDIGTLFCRVKRNGKFFLKDGNHRYLALMKNGETIVRIAYDKDNQV